MTEERAADPVSIAGTLLVVAGAAAIFTRIAGRVGSGESEHFDQESRAWLQEHRAPSLDVAVKPVTLLSLPAVVVPATLALAWRLWRDDRRAAALALLAAPVLAMSAGLSFSTFLSQRNPPDAADAPGGEVREPSFPSGHTTGVTAEALSVAFVLGREGLSGPATLAALLGWPLLVGTTRAYRDRHWASDVIGGWVAGSGVAAACALLYLLLPE
ncbi:MAG: phosphatidic acid phosphatase [Gemmatimonadetes bacterium]|nr:phosphatidic acid phosphatase [Gemmatimonadota bacterium]